MTAECNCNGHSVDCAYSTVLQTSNCTSCTDNTTGLSCELCLPGFYHDPVLPLSDPNTCKRKYPTPTKGMKHVCKSCFPLYHLTITSLCGDDKYVCVVFVCVHMGVCILVFVCGGCVCLCEGSHVCVCVRAYVSV